MNEFNHSKPGVRVIADSRVNGVNPKEYFHSSASGYMVSEEDGSLDIFKGERVVATYSRNSWGIAVIEDN